MSQVKQNLLNPNNKKQITPQHNNNTNHHKLQKRNNISNRKGRQIQFKPTLSTPYIIQFTTIVTAEHTTTILSQLQSHIQSINNTIHTANTNCVDNKLEPNGFEPVVLETTESTESIKALRQTHKRTQPHSTYSSYGILLGLNQCIRYIKSHRSTSMDPRQVKLIILAYDTSNNTRSNNDVIYYLMYQLSHIYQIHILPLQCTSIQLGDIFNIQHCMCCCIMNTTTAITNNDDNELHNTLLQQLYTHAYITQCNWLPIDGSDNINHTNNNLNTSTNHNKVQHVDYKPVHNIDTPPRRMLNRQID